MRQYSWDAKLTDLLPGLVTDCRKGARSVSMTGARRCSSGWDDGVVSGASSPSGPWCSHKGGAPTSAHSPVEDLQFPQRSLDVSLACVLTCTRRARQ